MKNTVFLAHLLLFGVSVYAMDDSTSLESSSSIEDDSELQMVSCDDGHDEDFLCSVVTEYYFKVEDRSIGLFVSPYLKPKIKKARQSMVSQIKILAEEKKQNPTIDLRDSQDEHKDQAFFQCVQEMINESLKEAFTEQDIESQKDKKLLNVKRLRLKIALITAGATVLTTTVSAIAAVIISVS